MESNRKYKDIGAMGQVKRRICQGGAVAPLLLPLFLELN